MAETYTVGKIPRTMTEVEAENAELRQWLLVVYRQAQSDAAALRQMSEGKGRSALGLELPTRPKVCLGMDVSGVASCCVSKAGLAANGPAFFSSRLPGHSYAIR